jgi:hypothetical protein
MMFFAPRLGLQKSRATRNFFPPIVREIRDWPSAESFILLGFAYQLFKMTTD